MTTHTTLAPCPFCGGRARRSQGGAWFGTGCGGSQSCPAHLRGLTYRTQCAADDAWNRRAQAPAPQGPSNAALADAIETACRGRKEWQVMNADETALCMWFTHDDYTRPAQAAQKWLDEHPTHKADGYHVVERHLFSTLEDLALEAAKRLRAAHGITGAPNGKPT